MKYDTNTQMIIVTLLVANAAALFGSKSAWLAVLNVAFILMFIHVKTTD